MVAKDGNKYCRTVFVECECWTHALELCKFHNEPEVYLHRWLVSSQRMSLLKRIKAAWQILAGSTWQLDEVVLDEEDVRKLVVCLEELVTAAQSGSEAK